MLIPTQARAWRAAGIACAIFATSNLHAQRAATPRPAPARPAVSPVVQRAVQRSPVVPTGTQGIDQGGTRRPSSAGGGTRAGEIVTGTLPGGGMAGCGVQRRTGDPAIDAALDFRRTRIRGSQLRKRVDRVRKALEWHSKLSDAQDAAAVQGKPILWIQTLGHLDGYL